VLNICAIMKPWAIVACVAWIAGSTATAAEPPAAKEHDDLKFHQAPKSLATGAATQDWPGFLGPTHNAVSAETHLLDKLPPSGPPLVWEVKKGSGYSSPAIADGKLLLLHRVGDSETVDCLEAGTGKRFWRYQYPTAYQDRYGYCDGPRAAPVIDSGLVFTIGAEAKVHCLDLSTGEVKWKHDLNEEYKLPQQFFGVGSTPLVEGDNLIVNVGAPSGPCVVAFNKTTGKIAWATDDKVTAKWGPSYASPIPATIHGQRRVFIFAGGESRPPTGGLICLDPATGKIDFTFKHRSRTYESVNASSPLIINGNQVFISETYGAQSVLLDLLPDGSAKPAWQSDRLGTHFMTAIPKDGHLYGVDGHGPQDNSFVCLSLKNGEEVWRKEVDIEETINTENGPAKRRIPLARASLLLLADGRFLCLGEYGHLLLLDLSPNGYKELSRSWLFAAGESWTLPVLSHGLLYVNQNSKDFQHNAETRVMCFDFRGK
jgi:outer membrane protein assembly factor BamB